VVYVTVSPDGSNVYAASETSNAIAVFSRDAGTGALSQLSGTAGCVSEDGTSGNCTNGLALTGALAVIVSPAGNHVSAASYISDPLPGSSGDGGAAPPPLTITTASPLPNGVVGTAYSQTFSATGGTAPYTWTLSAGSLPAGLNLSNAGLLSGPPSTAATSNFTVRVTDNASQTTTKDLNSPVKDKVAALKL